MLMGHYINSRDWENAHASVASLMQRLGEDAALFDLDANIFLLQGKTTEAEANGMKSLELEPAYENAYWTLINVYLATREFEKVVQTLDSMSSRLNYRFNPDELVASPHYAEFGRSKAYENWRDELLSK
jgi:predicted Zn-dependent protease